MAKELRNGSRIGRDNRSLKRVPELGYYYIVTDAEKTEKNYLEGIRDSLPEETRARLVIKVARAKTEKMVTECLSGAALHPQFAEPWIVFDRDEVMDFDAIIERAHNAGIRTGWSNPCVEIWFHAYFGKMPRCNNSVQCNESFETIFKAVTGQKYSKSDKNIYKILNRYGDE